MKFRMRKKEKTQSEIKEVEYVPSKYQPEVIEAIKEISERELMGRFIKETGKRAIYAGKSTKAFLAWKEGAE